MAVGRRWLGVLPRLTGRAWEDVAQGLEEFLRKLWDSEADGIPAGFGKDTIPSTIQAGVPSETGDLNSGWAAADHVHGVSTDDPSPLGVDITPEEGTSVSIARADHVHEMKTYRSIGVTVDGGVGTLTPGYKGSVAVPFHGTIVSWELQADGVGNCVFDVWKSWRKPTILNSICGASKPQLTAEAEATGDVLGWSELEVDEGDIVTFQIDSVDTIGVVTLVVKVREHGDGGVGLGSGGP